LTNIIQI